MGRGGGFARPRAAQWTWTVRSSVGTRPCSRTISFLSILFSAVHGQPPETTLAIPDDFVRQVMEGIGLAARESGLSGILARLKRYAADAIATRA